MTPCRFRVRQGWGPICAAFAAVLVVASNAGLAFSQSFLPVYKAGSGRFVVDYELGGDIERDDFFNRPIDVALDSRGNLFVLDYKECCIKKFDSTGAFVKTFGRKGEGPGEMASPTEVEIDPQDNVVVYDWGNQRFTLFDNMGEVIGTTNVNELGWQIVFHLRIDAKDRYAMETHEQRFQDVDPETKVSIWRFDIGKMHVTPIDSVVFRETYYLHNGAMTIAIRAPFAEGLIWNVMPAGEIVIADPADYTITFYSPDLAVIREIRHASEKKKVTDKDKEDYFEDWKEDELLRLKHKIEFPKYKPHFKELIVDGEGYLLFLVDEPTKDTQLYDVFTPEGEFLNRVTLPRMSRNAILTGKFIYTIARGEEDPVVRRYRLE
jgi:hypothetical protein